MRCGDPPADCNVQVRDQRTAGMFGWVGEYDGAFAGGRVLEYMTADRGRRSGMGGRLRTRHDALFRRTGCILSNSMSFTSRDVKSNGKVTVVVTRKYEQRLRADAAEQTRQNILDAVYKQLRKSPSHAVSVEQVARMAKVSRSTVYLIFGSRAGLFDALCTDLWWHRSGFQQVVDAVAHPDAREHLREGIDALVRVYAAHRDVFRALFSMAQLDADAVGGAITRMEAQRAGGMAPAAQRLADQGILRPDVTVDQAADVIWLVASFDSFDQLYTGRSLAADDVARVLITIAERSLCR